MDTPLAPVAPLQTPPWYRQSGLQLLLAVGVFLLPLVAIVFVSPQSVARQPLALRSQRVLRLYASRGASTVLVVQTATGLSRSIDGGTTFTRIDLGLPRSGLGKLWLVDWAVAAEDPSHLVALVGRPGQERLFRSNDAGASWRSAGRLPAAQSPESALRALVLAPADANIVYVIGERSLWRSHDGGESWTDARSLPESLATLEGVLVAPDGLDPATLFASAGIGLWRSRNAGQSWEPAGDLPPMAEISSLTVAGDRSGTVFAGGRGLVFASHDGGDTWMGAELPGAAHPVRVLLVDSRVGETAFAVDADGQFFRTDDAGRSWRFVDSAPGQQILDLALDLSGPIQLVAASTDGLWGQPIALLAPTPTPTATRTSTPTATSSPTNTATPAATHTPTATPTPTGTPTATETASPTSTATRRATPTRTALPTATAPAEGPSPTSTSLSATETPRSTESPTTPTVAPTNTPVPVPTDTPVPVPTATPQPTPEPR